MKLDDDQIKTWEAVSDKSMTTRILTVQEDPATGDCFIEIPEDFLMQLGWKEGDSINWSQQPDGSFLLSKVQS